jgi:hypothetical protein
MESIGDLARIPYRINLDAQHPEAAQITAGTFSDKSQ